MDWQGWFTLAVVAAVLVAMYLELADSDIILMGGLLTLATVGIVTPAETFAGKHYAVAEGAAAARCGRN